MAHECRDNSSGSTVERRTVATGAIEQIRRLVASGALAPGQQLPAERVLSELLGVSRPSLREAIHALASMGILEKRQGSGTYVTSLSSELLAPPLAFVLDTNPHALHDLFEVRLLLEVGAVEAAARHMDEAILHRLECLLTTLERCIDQIELFVEADITFHRMIHVASGNAILLALMESLRVLGKRSRMLTAQNRSIRESTYREHREILLALMGHNVEAAATAIRAHLHHVRAPLVDGS